MSNAQALVAFLNLVTTAAFVAGIYWLFKLIPWALRRLDVARPGGLQRLMAVAAVGAAGGALFLLRLKRRLLYAQAELAFGVVSAWFTLGRENITTFERTIGLVAAAYLVVRGLDNWRESLKQSTGPKADAESDKTR